MTDEGSIVLSAVPGKEIILESESGKKQFISTDFQALDILAFATSLTVSV